MRNGVFCLLNIDLDQFFELKRFWWRRRRRRRRWQIYRPITSNIQIFNTHTHTYTHTHTHDNNIFEVLFFKGLFKVLLNHLDILMNSLRFLEVWVNFKWTRHSNDSGLFRMLGIPLLWWLKWMVDVVDNPFIKGGPRFFGGFLKMLSQSVTSKSPTRTGPISIGVWKCSRIVRVRSVRVDPKGPPPPLRSPLPPPPRSLIIINRVELAKFGCEWFKTETKSRRSAKATIYVWFNWNRPWFSVYWTPPECRCWWRPWRRHKSCGVEHLSEAVNSFIYLFIFFFLSFFLFFYTSKIYFINP